MLPGYAVHVFQDKLIEGKLNDYRHITGHLDSFIVDTSQHNQYMFKFNNNKKNVTIV